MSVAIEMEPLISLATLPPDIIRMIVKMETETVDSMRLISHSWHSLSFGIQPPAPALERVYLCTNRARTANEYKVDEEEALQRVHMRAIFPERYSGRAGVGKWLKIDKKYDNAVEVACEPLRLVDDIDIILLIFLMTAMLWAGMAFPSAMLMAVQVISAMCYFHIVIPSLTILAVAGACIASAIAYYLEGQKRKARGRFARFFGMFTHIDTLVLHNFKNQELVFEALKKSLNGVRINQLEVIDKRVDEDFRSEIIALCRDHKIRNVFITTESISNIAIFAHGLCRLGVALDIYERSSSDAPTFFYASSVTWNQIATNLSRLGDTMRMRTAFDASLGHREYPYGIKSHIRCEKTDDATQKMTPVEISRGFKFN